MVLYYRLSRPDAVHIKFKKVVVVKDRGDRITYYDFDRLNDQVPLTEYDLSRLTTEPPTQRGPSSSSLVVTME